MDNKRLIFFSFGVAVLIVVGIIVLSSVVFETIPPKANLTAIPTHWNLKDEIVVEFEDESGIRDYRIQTILDGEVLSDTKEIVLSKPKTIKIPLPKPTTALKDGTIIQYNVEVTDWSNAHFFSGNSVHEQLRFTIDTTPPLIKPIAQSYQIARGGSAVVAFDIQDMALQDVSMSNGTDSFKLYKYQGDSIYVGIIAWPLKNKFFNASLSVKDKAGNISKQDITMVRNLNPTYYRSNIRVKEDFLSGKLNELIAQIDKKQLNIASDDNIERFRFFNETIRGEDENRIFSAVNVASDKSYIDEHFNAFLPLKGYKFVGSFGDHRTYFLGKDKISEAVHLGIDIASTKNAPIIVSNGGVVMLKSRLGLYGNTLVVYHGFGLASIYAHMSHSNIEVSDEVRSGEEVGKTGSTGWAFGDHLHFGILVQGHFVRLSEWLDQRWINDNVIAILMAAQDYAQNRQNK